MIDSTNREKGSGAMKRFLLLPAVVGFALLGAFGGITIASAVERSSTAPVVEAPTLSELPESVPIAGSDGPSGYIAKGELLAMVERSSMNLDAIEPGQTYETPLVGPTISGTLDVIGTRVCVVEVLDGGGRRQSCTEGQRFDNSLYVRDSSGVFVPRR